MISFHKLLYEGRTYVEVDIDLSDRRESERCKVIIGSPDEGEDYLLTANEAYDLANVIYNAAYAATTIRE